MQIPSYNSDMLRTCLPSRWKRWSYAASKQVVYVIDGENHVRERAVQVGLEGSQLVEIKSGLEEGEHVVVGGRGKYQEGELVRPVLTTTTASEVTRAPNSTIDLHDDEEGAQ